VDQFRHFIAPRRVRHLEGPKAESRFSTSADSTRLPLLQLLVLPVSCRRELCGVLAEKPIRPPISLDRTGSIFIDGLALTVEGPFCMFSLVDRFLRPIRPALLSLELPALKFTGLLPILSFSALPST
jgi:hypothetical protein